MEPEVSVIIACYNKGNYIRESVLSVLNQSFRNFELIIVDGHSNDSSVRQLEAMQAEDERIKLVPNTENKGANYCRNLGIKMARGNYLVFFDADDVLSASCLERRVKKMKEDVSLDFSVHTMQVFRKNIGDSNFKWIPASANPLRDFLAHDLPWQTMQPIWKRSVFSVVGGFDESFKRLQDVELHTRVLLQTSFKYRLFAEEPDCFYRTDEDRKNFEAFGFLERWLSSALQYCDKFSALLPAGKKKYLFGTVYQTYISVLLSYKAGQITEKEFEALEKKILQHSLVSAATPRQTLVLGIVKKYNLARLRVPGLNRLLKKLVLF